MVNCPKCGSKNIGINGLTTYYCNECNSRFQSDSIICPEDLVPPDEDVYNSCYGWICPKCGRSVSPNIAVCPCSETDIFTYEELLEIVSLTCMDKNNENSGR